MRQRRYHIILPFIFPLMSYAQDDCNLKRESENLKVYTCKSKNSKVKTVKVSLQVDGTLSKITSMILDVDFYKQWQYSTVRAKVLQKVSDTELYYYHEVHAPFVDNRDFAVRLTIHQDPVTRELTITAISVPDFIPKNKGIIRVPYSVGLWKVRPLAPSKLQVDYTVEVDLGGDLPAWIVNPLAPRASFETFDSFRKKMASYNGKPASFIKD